MPGPYGAARENGHKKSHRRWETVGQNQSSVLSGLRLNVISTIGTISLTLSISASPITLGIHNGFNHTIVIASRSLINGDITNSTRYLRQVLNRRLVSISNGNITRLSAILFGNNRLGCHDNTASFSNNRFLASTVNIASQSGDQQGGQDGQDDENDDELDEGEAFLFFILRIFSNIIIPPISPEGLQPSFYCEFIISYNLPNFNKVTAKQQKPFCCLVCTFFAKFFVALQRVPFDNAVASPFYFTHFCVIL